MNQSTYETDPASFNDDDWYEYDRNTLEIVRVVGSKSPRPQARELHHVVVSGMSAKYLGLRHRNREQALIAALRRTTFLLSSARLVIEDAEARAIATEAVREANALLQDPAVQARREARYSQIATGATS